MTSRKRAAVVAVLTAIALGVVLFAVLMPGGRPAPERVPKADLSQAAPEWDGDAGRGADAAASAEEAEAMAPALEEEAPATEGETAFNPPHPKPDLRSGSGFPDLSTMDPAEIQDGMSGALDDIADEGEEADSEEAEEEEDPDQPPNTVQLEVLVRDRMTKEPIAGANVEAYGFSGTARPGIVQTDAEGIAVVYPAAEHSQASLTVDAEGYPQHVVRRLQLRERMNEVVELGRGGGVRGRVVDSRNGAPVPDAQVQLITAPGLYWDLPLEDQTVVTDSDGAFEMRGLESGRQTLEITTGGRYAKMQESVSIRDSEITNAGEIELHPGYLLSAQVVREPANVPVPGVTITCRLDMVPGAETQTEVTDAGGLVEFVTEANGLYVLNLPDQNWRAYVDVEDEIAQHVRIPLGDGSLRLETLENGEPFSANTRVFIASQGANVSSTWQLTGDDGVRELSGMAPGGWMAQVRHPETRETKRQSFAIREGQRTDLTVEFGGAELNGLVLESDGGPLKDAQVSIYAPENGTSAVTTTDLNGRFRFSDLEAAVVELTAKKDELGMRQAAVVNVANAGVVELVLERLQAGTVVSNAYSFEDGAPVPGAWLELQEAGGTWFWRGEDRDQYGELTVEGVPPGTYNTEVSAWGMSVERGRVEVSAGETARIEDVLFRAGALRWLVLDKAGLPVPGLQVDITPVEAESIDTLRTGRTDANGEVVFRGLFPGVWRGTVLLNAEPVLSQEFSIAEGELTTLGGTVP